VLTTMRPRSGFTMVEVMIALVIMGIVTGSIYKLLDTSQRISLAQAEQVDLQANVRTGSLVVPNELRELNTVTTGAANGPQNDVLIANASQVRYRAMRGLGFVCAATATTLTISSATWTGLRAPDATRDDIYVFLDLNQSINTDDSWLQVNITAAALSANGCGAGLPGYVLTAAAMPPVPVSTPLRSYEVMEFRLYTDAGEWWLGAQSISAGENIQPVLGPLTANGFQLVYLDANGNVTANTPAIKSIRVTVRGLTDAAVRDNGTAALGHPEEQLVTQVLLRNSIRP
jgi:prepilin-type N-terminal cleavage/methylation domain-containing protein